MVGQNVDDSNFEFRTEDEDPNTGDRRSTTYENKKQRAIFSVPVEVVVSVGNARPLIGDLLNMRREAIIPLDSRINDPVEVRVGEKIIARGELQEMEDGSGRLSVRLTEVMEIDSMF